MLAQDVSRPIGGIKQIFRLASALHRLNYNIRIVQKTSDFRPDWFSFPDSLDLVSLSTFNAHVFDIETDVVVIPETFIPYYFKLPKVRKVIFNQNFGYTFGEKLDIDESHVFRVYNDSLAYILCVSLPDYLSITRLVTDSPDRVGSLVNPIETNLFSASFPKDRSIIYMPRKNSHHSRILTSFIKRTDWFDSEGWTLDPIDNLSLTDVASLMQKAFIFLSFGYPEGFGLPIAEALSCGCIVVGYSVLVVLSFLIFHPLILARMQLTTLNLIVFCQQCQMQLQATLHQNANTLLTTCRAYVLLIFPRDIHTTIFSNM